MTEFKYFFTPIINSVARKTRRGLGPLFLFLLAPEGRGEGAKRREFMTNVVALINFTFAFLSALFMFFNVERIIFFLPPLTIEVYSIFAAWFFSLYVFSRKGYWKMAAYGIISAYFAMIIPVAWITNLYRPAVILFCGLIVVMATVMIRARLGSLVVFLAAVAIFAHSEYFGAVSRPSGTLAAEESIRESFWCSAILLLMLVLSWLANREVAMALYRARSSEKDLMAERSMLEARICERTEELRRAHRDSLGQLYRFSEFGRIASGFFHGFVNQFTIVSLHLEALKGQIISEIPSMKKQLEKISDITSRMEQFVRAARRQLERSETRELFSVDQALREIMDLVKFKAHKFGVRLRLIVRNQIKCVGNSAKFHQIVMNLVSNAIDACEMEICTASAGAATISEKSVTVTVQRDRDEAIIRVTDNGKGMSKEIQNRIFEPFFSTKDFARGMGIGLSITRDIVEKDLGGSISVKSKEGKGTVVVVRFLAPDIPCGQLPLPSAN